MICRHVIACRGFFNGDVRAFKVVLVFEFAENFLVVRQKSAFCGCEDYQIIGEVRFGAW